ncbi:T9SS type A sorting domain-containing protein [Kaistella sp.]|uniref:T9SS type A sorting domain-containing protein n=1 Tax=Kaistella sp. TaxID=2782235 RepID=UPI003C5AAC56
MKKILLTGFALVSMVSQAQSWVDQATKFPANTGVKEVVVVDANTVWASAYDGAGGGTYPKIVTRTTNGGSTWTATNITGPGSNALVSDIAAIDGNTAWVVTAPFNTGSNANRMWKTTNGGTSWSQQTIGYTAGSFANHVYFWDANNGWSSGDPLNGKFEMFKTSNGGTTWTSVAGALVPENDDEFTYVGLKKVVGDNIWVGTSIGRILHSANRGTTWTGHYSPVLDFGGVITTGSTGSMAFKDANNGILIAVDGQTAGSTPSAGIYSSTDGGANWVEIETTGTWYFGDITYVPGTENTYVTTGINSSSDEFMGSAYSTDGGKTWINIDSGEQRGTLGFLNATTGWAGQFSDGPTGTKGILKFNGNLSLAVADNAVKSSLKVYPNPASDVVTVTSNKEIQAVNIIDLSGKRVQTTKTTGKVNVSSLAKGTYILQVYYGNGAVENTKLIKN